MVAFSVVAAVKDQAIILAGVWTSTEKIPLMKCGYTVSLYAGLLQRQRLQVDLLGDHKRISQSLLQKS